MPFKLLRKGISNTAEKLVKFWQKWRLHYTYEMFHKPLAIVISINSTPFHWRICSISRHQSDMGKSIWMILCNNILPNNLSMWPKLSEMTKSDLWVQSSVGHQTCKQLRCFYVNCKGSRYPKAPDNIWELLSKIPTVVCPSNSLDITSLDYPSVCFKFRHLCAEALNSPSPFLSLILLKQ